MPKLHKFHEYEVTVSGIALQPFTVTRNQVASNAEQAAKIVKKGLKGSKLDWLDPKISYGQMVVKSVETETINPPKTD